MARNSFRDNASGNAGVHHHCHRISLWYGMDSARDSVSGME